MTRYVVTGCARGGTAYVAELLTAAGLNCGHEAIWGAWAPDFGERCLTPPTPLEGDCSFIAAPFIGRYSPAVHLVRPPLDVIRSICGNAWLANPLMPYVRFVDHHTGGAVLAQPPGPRRAAAYWVAWNRLIESGKPELRWDVTAIEPGHILDLAALVGLRVSMAKARRAQRGTDRAINHRLPPAGWITQDDLGQLAGAVVEMAAQYRIPLEHESEAR